MHFPNRTNIYEIILVCHSDDIVFVFRCTSKHMASMLASGSSWTLFSSLSHGKYVPVVDKNEWQLPVHHSVCFSVCFLSGISDG